MQFQLPKPCLNIGSVVMLQYFRDCVEMMMMESNIEEIVQESIQNNTSLHIVAAEFQRDVLGTHCYDFIPLNCRR
jgi:hypothetical protein